MAVLFTGFAWWVSSHDRNAVWRTVTEPQVKGSDR
jgi:hypothetical protein